MSKVNLKTAAYVSTATLILLVRLIRLDADPPPWLSWSSGIYSDEGIYASDARSLALFGCWAPGDFHSAIIAPLHHLLLLGVFKVFGVSLLTVRAFDVVCSLVSLIFFTLALRRQFDDRSAFTGLIFLGLSPIYVFYNRLGLMETPTVLLLTAALYASTFEEGTIAEGFLLALAVIYKPLALLCVPAFFVDLKQHPKQAAARLSVLVAGIAAYALIWQAPHRTALAKANRYYLLHQYLPHSTAGIVHDLIRSLFIGEADGVIPYLLHTAPVLICLAAIALFQQSAKDTRTLRFLFWFAVPATAFCFISYAPSRYFVLFLPGLAGAAAISVNQLDMIWRRTIVSAFVALSLLTIALSLQSATYEIERGGKLLRTTLPAGTTIVGQYAPELALSNCFRAMYVQPKLANSVGFLGSGMILITRSPFWDNYWSDREDGKLTPTPQFSLSLPKSQSVDFYPAPASGESSSRL